MGRGIFPLSLAWNAIFITCQDHMLKNTKHAPKKRFPLKNVFSSCSFINITFPPDLESVTDCSSSGQGCCSSVLTPEGQSCLLQKQTSPKLPALPDFQSQRPTTSPLITGSNHERFLHPMSPF